MTNGNGAVKQVEHVAGVFEETIQKAIRKGKHFSVIAKMTRDFRGVLHDITMDSYERDEFDVADAADAAYDRLTLILDVYFATISAAHDKEMEKFNTNREES